MTDFWERLGKKNWNQFFFRLWVLFTIPFVIAIIFIITEELLTPTGQTITNVQTVDVKGVGKVNFPDHYTTKQIVTAIETDILPTFPAIPEGYVLDSPLSYKDADITRKFNFRRVAERVYLPILFPLGALLAGLSIRWLFRGLHKN